MYSLLLAMSVLSMVLTPFVSGLASPIYQLRKRLFRHEPLQTANIPETGFKDHVVIAGGGRVGQHIAQALTEISIPFVLIELNHQRLLECKASGHPVIYGDMSQDAVIDASQLQAARLLLITTPSVITSQFIIQQARRLRPDLHIIARANGAEQAQALYESGVYMAVLPEMEAGLEIARQALLHLEIPVTVIQEYTDAVRQQLYAPLFEPHGGQQLLAMLGEVKNLLEISWFEIHHESHLVGRSIAEAAVRTRTGASIVGIIHAGVFHSNPQISQVFQAGDMVAVVGSQQERNAFRQLAEKMAM